MRKKLKCLIIGYGSVGKRHAENFKKLNCDVLIWVRKVNKVQDNKFKYIHNIDDYINEIDFVVISTITNTHTKYILKCLDYKKNIYLEKPITNNNNDIKKIVKHKNFNKVKIQVGCQIRSDPQIFKIKKIIKEKKLGKALTYQSYVGQNLDTWRDKIGLKYYSAYKNKGGGVCWDLIHDIDIAYYLLGDFKIFYSLKSRQSKLTFDSEDYCNLIIKFKSSKIFGNIILDMLNPIYSRNIKIIFEKGSIFWDENLRKIIVVKSLKKTVKKNTFFDNKKRNDIFLLHSKNFINSIKENVKLNCDFNDFKKINLKIDKINAA